ncbi:MAG: hypothetical protein HYT22_01175 [Candidatus Niyogibacteria bacterium]|nr:hypothetical protein [Candidatus Niyogibacteria bacterium]
MSQLFTVKPAFGESALILLTVTKSLIHGHFVLRSKDHADEYVNARKLFANPERFWRMCRLFAFCVDPSAPIDTVVGPARGGNDLAKGVAYWLSQLRFPSPKKDPDDSPIRCAWTDKVGKDDFAVAECHEEFVRGKRILLVDDVSTKGGSLEKVKRSVQKVGGEVVLALTIWNRGGVTPGKLGIPIGSLITKEIPSWPPDQCPLCKDGVPINTDVGHGKEFLENKRMQNRETSIPVGATDWSF